MESAFERALLRIPPQLRERPGARFTVIINGNKKPEGKDWSGPNGANYGIDDAPLAGYLAEGHNYGVLCGHAGITVLDLDDPARLEELGIVARIPDTCQARTGRGGLHVYLDCPELDHQIGLYDPDLKDKDGEPLHLGEIQSFGQQVVGPGSIHPNGNRYEIINDASILKISKADLLKIFDGLILTGLEDPAEEPRRSSERRRRAGGSSIGDSIPIDQVCWPVDVKERTGPEVIGSHPLHGSTTGKNFSVNTAKNCWHCFRCGPPQKNKNKRGGGGGGPLEWIAVDAGLISCKDAKPGCLDDKALFKKVLQIARDKGFDIPEQERPKADETKIKAEDVCDIEINEDTGEWEKITLAPTKASKAILAYFTLAMEKGDDQIYYYNSDGIYDPDGARKIDLVLTSAAKDANNNFKLREVLRRVRNQLLEGPVTFDPDPYVLGVSNGLIDLRTGDFREYRPEDLITDRIDVIYDPDAKCPATLAYIESLTPCETTRLMLIDWFAATAIKEPLPYVLFLLGLGRNGKGIYEKLLKKFFGRAAFRDMPLQSIEKSDFAASEFYKKRGWIASETGRGKASIGTDFMKLTSGNGVIDANVKGKSRIQYEPFFQTTVDTNTMPQIADNSIGWEERFCAASLPYVFVPNPDPDNPLEKLRDPHLFDKLTTPSELSGLLNLVIYRAKEIAKTKTITKRSGKEMFAEYQEQSASVGTFLEQFCEYVTDGKEFWTPSTPIYDAYKEWCGYKVGEVVDSGYFGKRLTAFCGGKDGKDNTISKVGKSKDRKSVRLYKRLNFDQKRYDDEVKRLRQSMSTGVYSKSTASLQCDSSTDSDVYSVYSKTWIEIYKRFGDPSKNHIYGGICENTVDTVDTVDIDSSEGPKVSTPSNLTVDAPVDSQRESVESNLMVCAKCGADLTGRGTVERGGKIYCALPGCGYSEREEAGT